MKAYLRVITQHFAAGQAFARLPLAGNFLRVLAAPAPFSFVLGDESTVELVPGMGVSLPDNQAFQELRISRANPTEPAALQIAVAWQPKDAPLILHDNRAVADITNTQNIKVDIGDITTTTGALYVESPAVRSRFVPRHSAVLNMRNQAKYSPDFTAAPTITAAAAPALNLLAPFNPAVIRRTVRLVSGSSATVGFESARMQTAGNSWTLTTAAPERVIDGAESLFGYSAEACAFVITETIQSPGTVATFATFAASLTPAEKAALPAPTASGSVSWAFSSGASWGTGMWNQITADNLLHPTYVSKVTKSGTTSTDTWTFSFAGITSAEMTSMDTASISSPGLRSGILQYTNRVILQIGSGTGTVTFSTGQSFKIAGATNGEALFRISWLDDEPPFVERCHGIVNSDNYSWSRNEKPSLL